MKQQASHTKSTRGFSLIEVLVALIVTSIGLLGLAALQATSLKVNHGSHLRSQATQFAHDIADRMRANRVAALDGDYDLDFTGTTSPGTVAETDLDEWRDGLSLQMPSGSGAVDVNNVGLAVIRVRWNDARGDAGSENVDGDGDGLLEFRLVTEI